MGQYLIIDKIDDLLKCDIHHCCAEHEEGSLTLGLLLAFRSKMDLPPELLARIFDLLLVSDVKVCREVCRRWAWSGALALSSRCQLVLQENRPEHHPWNLESLGAHLTRRLVIRGASISFSNDRAAQSWAWGRALIPDLQALVLDACPVGEKDLVRILRHQDPQQDGPQDDRLPAEGAPPGSAPLRSLALKDARDTFIEGRLRHLPLLNEAILGGLNELDLSKNEYLTDSILSNFIQMTPRLSALVLNDIKVQSHPGILKKFYPEKDEGSVGLEFNSSAVLTFWCLRSAVHHLRKTLKILSLRGVGLQDKDLVSLSAIPDLALVKLDLYNNVGIKIGGVAALANSSSGPSLRDLDIGLCRRVLMDFVPGLSDLAFERLFRLERMGLRALSCSRNFSVLLSKLRHLKHLDLTEVDVAGEQVAQGIMLSLSHSKSDNVSWPPSVSPLEVLVLNRANLCSVDILHVILPNLTELYLEDCPNTVTADLVKGICSTCRRLKVLNLNGCFSFTEAFVYSEGLVDPCPELQKLLLRKTSLSGSPRPLEFPDLRLIDISQCRSLTERAVMDLATANPTLERIVAQECPGITEASVRHLVTNLKRLVSLDVRRCPKVSSTLLSELPSLCPRLTFLDCSYCPYVTWEVVEELKKALPLLRIRWKGHDVSHDDDIIWADPPPPPPPAPSGLFRRLLR